MTVPEALALVRGVGEVDIQGGNLRIRLPEKERVRFLDALVTLRRCKAEALAVLAGEFSAAPEQPDADCRGEFDLISRITDDWARDEVIALKYVLGGTLSPAGRPGRFVSVAQYQKDMLDALFGEHRKLQAPQYAGLTLQEKETLARKQERAERDRRKDWWAEQQTPRRRSQL